MNTRKMMLASSLAAIFACCFSGTLGGCGDDGSSTAGEPNTDGTGDASVDAESDAAVADDGDTDVNEKDVADVECAGYETRCGSQCCTSTQRCEANACVDQPIISAGGMHTCAASSSGKAKCWGDNSWGQLGFGNGPLESKLPLQVAGLESDVAFLASGGTSACALQTEGKVWCWGMNVDGKLGVGNNSPRVWYPRPVIGLPSDRIVAIHPGESHVCALTNRGEVYCWGDNSEGQLGDGTFVYKAVPTRVVGLRSPAIAIGASAFATCALTSDKRVSCWGLGAIGNGNHGPQASPAPVMGLEHSVVAISNPGYSACALTSDGDVYCWGENSFGQLGDGSQDDRLVAVRVVDLPAKIKAVAVGDVHVCAITSANGVVCWGSNEYGQLGVGITPTELPFSKTPRQLSTLTSGVMALSAGVAHNCVVLEDGKAKCWGANPHGELGNGNSDNKSSPDAVKDFPWE